MTKTSDKSAAHKAQCNEMNEIGESSALFYSPSHRSREQIDLDVSQGRVYPLADVLFKFLFGRPERAELFLDLLNALMFPNGERAFTQVAFIDREFPPVRASGGGAAWTSSPGLTASWSTWRSKSAANRAT